MSSFESQIFLPSPEFDLQLSFNTQNSFDSGTVHNQMVMALLHIGRRMAMCLILVRLQAAYRHFVFRKLLTYQLVSIDDNHNESFLRKKKLPRENFEFRSNRLPHWESHLSLDLVLKALFGTYYT